jgi:hypothetical protein
MMAGTAKLKRGPMIMTCTSLKVDQSAKMKEATEMPTLEARVRERREVLRSSLIALPMLLPPEEPGEPPQPSLPAAPLPALPTSAAAAPRTHLRATPLLRQPAAVPALHRTATVPEKNTPEAFKVQQARSWSHKILLPGQKKQMVTACAAKRTSW